MFTGIVEEVGTIRSIHRSSKSIELVVEASLICGDLKVGDSINTNGICLTVTTFDAHSFTVDVMPETMQRTNFGELRVGGEVNLERAMRLSDRLGGHIVSGHIDGTGVVKSIRKDDIAVWYTISTDATILKYIIEKGSVALDGISLTVAHVDAHTFEVSIIPHTQQVTALKNRKIGSTVNIECDMIGKYVEKLLGREPGQSKITMNYLAEQGFI